MLLPYAHVCNKYFFICNFLQKEQTEEQTKWTNDSLAKERHRIGKRTAKERQKKGEEAIRSRKDNVPIPR